MSSRKSLSTLRVAALSLAGVVGLACGDGGSSSPTASTPAPKTSAPAAAPAKPAAPAAVEEVDLVALGRSTYMSNCIACHNPDPTMDGALGPAVSGSSFELLEARIVHGTYPEGYTPKRTSGNMVPLPFLADKIPALAAYLNASG